MTELILAYIGAMFIAFEFIRKFHSFRVLPILIMHLPFRPALNKMPFMKFVEAKEGKKELDKKEIKKGLSGNLCRCGNFTKIYQAVDQAAKAGRS